MCTRARVYDIFYFLLALGVFPRFAADDLFLVVDFAPVLLRFVKPLPFMLLHSATKSSSLTTLGTGAGLGSLRGLIHLQHMVPQLCPTVLIQLMSGT